MKSIFLFLSFITLSIAVKAQNVNTDEPTDTATTSNTTYVNVYVDSRLDALANKSNRPTATSTAKALRVRGYRVQLYNGTNKQDAEKIKMDFVKIYPRTRAYMTFSSPNYKLRVGDFKSRSEADEFLNTASRLFRNTMIVPEMVNNN